MKKIFAIKTTIGGLKKSYGSDIFYRTTGGRYFKVITNYSTGSTKEKAISFENEISNTIGAILSSNLYFWFYQIYSNNLDLKTYEIDSFTVPLDKIKAITITEIETAYSKYLIDIEKNARRRQTTQYANIDSFMEYKIGKSKHLIDEIDNLIAPLYGLNDDELNFIKNYEIQFRLTDEN